MQGNGLIEMEVNKIRIDERRGEQIIVLREKGGARLLPIIIGISEVTAIKMKVSGIEPPRPLLSAANRRALECGPRRSTPIPRAE